MKTNFENIEDLFGEIIAKIQCKQPLLFNASILAKILYELWYCVEEFSKAKCDKAPTQEQIFTTTDGYTSVGCKEVPRNIFDIPLSAEPIFTFFVAASNCNAIFDAMKTGKFGELVAELKAIKKDNFNLSLRGYTFYQSFSDMVSVAALFDNIHNFQRRLNG